MHVRNDIREAGTLPKRKERGPELSWTVPVDNERVTGLSIVAWPLEDGAPKDWRPGTRTIPIRSQWPLDDRGFLTQGDLPERLN